VGADWSIEERAGTAADLHAGWVPADPRARSVARCRVAGPAVVLGSTQSEAVVDGTAARAAGLEVARRRSGGGAVLVVPGDPVWIDVWVPRSDPLWEEDVARAFDWLGATWSRALASLGHPDAVPHAGAYVACTRWCSLVCFGGVGAGEVTVGDGRKVVGLAQRRTRDGAWFHGACVLHWEPTPLLAALRLPDAERTAAHRDLSGVAAGLNDVAGPGVVPVDRVAVEAAFVAALP
jgi:lipoate---protein ligase